MFDELSKSIWQKEFGEWINFVHKDTNYELLFGWLKFSEALNIHQTFPTVHLSCAVHGSYFNDIFFIFMQSCGKGLITKECREMYVL